MTRETFDSQLDGLLSDLIQISSLVEEAIKQSVVALKQQNKELARQVYQGDQVINERRFQIENDSLTLIATQSPMARDLRLVASILDITSELERIGDYAKGIAKIAILTADMPHIKPLIDIPRMADISSEMLHNALGAFIQEDLDTALSIPQQDDLVDSLYNQVYRELLTFMMADPTIIDRANFLLWAAHNLERTADRVINICERTAYLITGEMREIRYPMDDTFSQ